MQPSDAPVLLYLWDKRTFYLSAFAEPLQLSQAAQCAGTVRAFALWVPALLPNRCTGTDRGRAGSNH